MRTLYLRSVPDEVVERLEKRAKAESTSVSSLAVRELTEVSKRYDNAAVLRDLPSTGITMAEIVEGIRRDRDSR